MDKFKDFEEKLNVLKKEFEELKKVQKKSLKAGNVFEVAGLKWKVLEKMENGVFCILEGFSDVSKNFDDDTNNWKDSLLRKYLNSSFKDKVEKSISYSLVEFERNLLSLDGQEEYGFCKDKISLLTVNEYRKYRKLLPNTKKWWWLCTPWSTPCNDYKTSVAVVSPSGLICSNYCFSFDGVRPVCIFPSEIFESEEV